MSWALRKRFERKASKVAIVKTRKSADSPLSLLVRFSGVGDGNGIGVAIVALDATSVQLLIRQVDRLEPPPAHGKKPYEFAVAASSGEQLIGGQALATAQAGPQCSVHGIVTPPHNGPAVGFGRTRLLE